MIPLLALAILPPSLAAHCVPSGERAWECRHQDRPFTLSLPAQPTTSSLLLLPAAVRNHGTRLAQRELGWRAVHGFDAVLAEIDANQSQSPPRTPFPDVAPAGPPPASPA